MTPSLFADSNVLIEALLIPNSAAYIVAEMVARGAFDLVTCKLCVEDAEDAIIAKLQNKSEELDKAIIAWGELKALMRLAVVEDPKSETVLATQKKYLGVMRHGADIPVLAAALSLQPQPSVILSGNREHFNDAVAERCGIRIYSCQEFLEFIAEV